MPPHSIGSGTISFGLVSIPIKLYTAASWGGVSFNLLHDRLDPDAVIVGD